MYTFLIILGIYLIGVVYLHISLYFDWIKEDKCGQDFKDLVPESVYKYIKSNNLYVNSAKTQGAEAN